jgi:hypothetical protein
MISDRITHTYIITLDKMLKVYIVSGRTMKEYRSKEYEHISKRNI